MELPRELMEGFGEDRTPTRLSCRYCSGPLDEDSACQACAQASLEERIAAAAEGREAAPWALEKRGGRQNQTGLVYSKECLSDLRFDPACGPWKPITIWVDGVEVEQEFAPVVRQKSKLTDIIPPSVIEDFAKAVDDAEQEYLRQLKESVSERKKRIMDEISKQDQEPTE